MDKYGLHHFNIGFSDGWEGRICNNSIVPWSEQANYRDGWFKGLNDRIKQDNEKRLIRLLKKGEA